MRSPDPSFASFWDEARDELSPERRILNLTLIVALGLAAWGVPVAVIFWLVG